MDLWCVSLVYHGVSLIFGNGLGQGCEISKALAAWTQGIEQVIHQMINKCNDWHSGSHGNVGDVAIWPEDHSTQQKEVPAQEAFLIFSFHLFAEIAGFWIKQILVKFLCRPHMKLRMRCKLKMCWMEWRSGPPHRHTHTHGCNRDMLRQFYTCPTCTRLLNRQRRWSMPMLSPSQKSKWPGLAGTMDLLFTCEFYIQSSLDVLLLIPSFCVYFVYFQKIDAFLILFDLFLESMSSCHRLSLSILFKA